MSKFQFLGFCGALLAVGLFAMIASANRSESSSTTAGAKDCSCASCDCGGKCGDGCTCDDCQCGKSTTDATASCGKCCSTTSTAVATTAASEAECCCGADCQCEECGCASGQCTDCQCEGCDCTGCECGGDCGSACCTKDAA